MNEVVIFRSLYQLPVSMNHIEGCGLEQAARTLLALANETHDRLLLNRSSSN